MTTSSDSSVTRCETCGLTRYEHQDHAHDTLKGSHGTCPFGDCNTFVPAPAPSTDLASDLEDDIDYEKAARFLFDRLDDIDTLDDACKGDDHAFREQVRRVQRRRFEVASTDGFSVTFRQENYVGDEEKSR